MFTFLLLLQLQVPTIVNKPLPIKKEIRDTTKNFIILHYDGGESYTIARRTLIRRRLSYHYYIQRDGKIIQLVDPKYKASHVGLSYYKGYVRLNNYSIGICLQNNSQQEYTQKQYESLGYLAAQLQKQYRDSTARIIVGHSDAALPFGRKIDPGPRFNWNTLHTILNKWTGT